MSIRIIKAGIFDTVQDKGRYGHQHWGINPGGAMDVFSAQTASLLVGNKRNDAVIEIHFPGPAILFQEQALISLCGGDFSASVNGEPVPSCQPVIVNRNCLLQFHKQARGARDYMAIRQLKIESWLGSYSTNTKAHTGGFGGRNLKKDDVIAFREIQDYETYLRGRDHLVLPWHADINWNDPLPAGLFVLKGSEWDWFDEESREQFLERPFYISISSDRMGDMVVGPTLRLREKGELVSAGVCFGTIQLLPGGQMIILMADHQTAGGYPRIGYVATAHLPKLSQMIAGQQLVFRVTDQETAEKMMVRQHEHLNLLEHSCNWNLEHYFKY